SAPAAWARPAGRLGQLAVQRGGARSVSYLLSQPAVGRMTGNGECQGAGGAGRPSGGGIPRDGAPPPPDVSLPGWSLFGKLTVVISNRLILALIWHERSVASNNEG